MSVLARPLAQKTAVTTRRRSPKADQRLSKRAEALRGIPQSLTNSVMRLSTHLHCSKCGSGNLRRSHQTRFKDYILRMFFLHPFRCRSCNRRVYLQAASA